jgi:hypothetical protein
MTKQLNFSLIFVIVFAIFTQSCDLEKNFLKALEQSSASKNKIYTSSNQHLTSLVISSNNIIRSVLGRLPNGEKTTKIGYSGSSPTKRYSLNGIKKITVHVGLLNNHKVISSITFYYKNGYISQAGSRKGTTNNIAVDYFINNDFQGYQVKNTNGPIDIFKVLTSNSNQNIRNARKIENYSNKNYLAKTESKNNNEKHEYVMSLEKGDVLHGFIVNSGQVIDAFGAYHTHDRGKQKFSKTGGNGGGETMIHEMGKLDKIIVKQGYFEGQLVVINITFVYLSGFSKSLGTMQGTKAISSITYRIRGKKIVGYTARSKNKFLNYLVFKTSP